MAPAQGVSEALIRRLVEAFYTRVRQDPDLGPIFEDAVAQRWDAHLKTLVDFWSSVALRTGRYAGKPHQAHAALPLTPALFERWLALFGATAREVCEPDAAAFFVDRAGRIADSLQIGLGMRENAVPRPSGRPATV